MFDRIRQAVSPRFLTAGLAAAATLIAFVQIERGLGNLRLSLLYVGHDLLVSAALALVVLVAVRRPWASAFSGVAAVLLVWFASYLKVRATSVPVFAADLPRLLDAWQVVVAFGWPALLAALASVVAGVLILRWEQPVRLAWLQRLVCLGLGGVLLVGSGLIQAKIPPEDLVNLTRIPKVAFFARSIYTAPDFHDARFPDLDPYCCFRNSVRPSVAFAGTVKPNIVVVLQESTFPPDNLRSVAPMRNRLLDGSVPMQVDVAGGGTWVEEYALLHGVPPSVYGRDFLQIMWLGRSRGLEPRLAPMLADAGYRTSSILPYVGSMIGDSVGLQRSLGFPEVIDCIGVEGCGQSAEWMNLPDAAIYRRVLDQLRGREGPAFVYAATIRQHSPHVLRFPLHAYRDEVMAEYLRRLEMSSAELDDFLKSVATLVRPTIVMVFGDHIPGDVNAAFPDHEFRAGRYRTFFNLYDAEGRPVAAKVMAEFASVEAPSTAFLDAILLRFAGFQGDYIDRKLRMMGRCFGEFCGRQDEHRQAVAARPAG